MESDPVIRFLNPYRCWSRFLVSNFRIRASCPGLPLIRVSSYVDSGIHLWNWNRLPGFGPVSVYLFWILIRLANFTVQFSFLTIQASRFLWFCLSIRVPCSGFWFASGYLTIGLTFWSRIRLSRFRPILRYLVMNLDSGTHLWREFGY